MAALNAVTSAQIRANLARRGPISTQQFVWQQY
jgi:hypothetical protein